MMRRMMYARNDHNATLEGLETGELFNKVADKAFKRPSMAHLSFDSMQDVNEVLQAKKEEKEDRKA